MGYCCNCIHFHKDYEKLEKKEWSDGSYEYYYKTHEYWCSYLDDDVAWGGRCNHFSEKDTKENSGYRE